MIDLLTVNPAIALLKKDRDTVKDLFDEFEKSRGSARKKENREADTDSCGA